MCSCSEDCVDSHPCKPEAPHSVNILIAGAEVHPNRFDTMCAFLAVEELLPAGSVVQSVQLTDSIPSLEILLQFDAVLLYTVGWLLDKDRVGDIMADYVDSGGGLVMCQWSMHFGSVEIGGRLKEPGYAPFDPGPTGNILDERAINLDENIIGINTCPNMAFSPQDEYSNGAKLIANSLLFVAGASE
jgi:hypothetical protein